MQLRTPVTDDVTLFGALVIPRHATDLKLSKLTVADASVATGGTVFLKLDTCFKDKTTNGTDCPAAKETLTENNASFFLQMETNAVLTPALDWTHLIMDQDLKVNNTCNDTQKMAKCRN